MSLSLLLIISTTLCTVLSISIPIDVEQPQNDLIVNTLNGPVLGFEASGARIWQGIPYATAPVGSLRWTSPKGPQSWTETKDCTKLGKMCAQVRDGKLIGSEDCLFLNIYVPSAPTISGPLPVLFWIYGGGFNDGDSDLEGLYDGRDLARTQNVIVVTHNYRVGALGFLGVQELANENKGSTGNYGVQDQRAALQWVKQNIAFFGGDSKRVMIYGQSAGAMSVCFHLGSIDSFSLFSSAVMESGTCDSIDFFRTMKNADSFGADYARGLNCSRESMSSSSFLSCLRSKSAFDVLTAQPVGNGFRSRLVPYYYWGPNIDNTTSGLKDYPVFVIASGDWARVPLIAGSNQDEGSIFLADIPGMVPGVTLPLSESEVKTTLLHFFSSDIVNQLLTVYYPLTAYQSPDEQTAAILRDYIFSCPTRRALSKISQQGRNGWMYHFTYQNDWIDYKAAGDYHAFELFFVFDNQWPRGVHNFTAADQTMADTFGYYWGNLGGAQNPNVDETGTQKFLNWPTYDTKTRTNMALTVPLKTETFLFAKSCDYMDQVIFVAETGGFKN
eukprot:TRINITY_DN3420_c0_g1_i1.p1 TRINITY_DN3420_c0_g1~~TRINITY_DN3420_c0_g1_i1.p1  ORF type:complete len:585 (-),score=131.46 TRINITY_DN3420_c0_g1_i1:914-2581(-)